MRRNHLGKGHASGRDSAREGRRSCGWKQKSKERLGGEDRREVREEEVASCYSCFCQ